MGFYIEKEALLLMAPCNVQFLGPFRRVSREPLWLSEELTTFRRTLSAEVRQFPSVFFFLCGNSLAL